MNFFRKFYMKKCKDVTRGGSWVASFGSKKKYFYFLEVFTSQK